MWDACAQLNMPVAIHVSDPIAFFTPTDRFNERYEELNNHPDWSFYGGDFPRTKSCWRRAIALWRGIPERNSSCCMSETSPRICKTLRTTWTASRTCSSILPRESASSGGSQDRSRVLRQVSRPDSLRDRCDSSRRRLSAAGFQHQIVRNLLSFPRNGRRVLRLRSGESAAARPVENLRNQSAGLDL